MAPLSPSAPTWRFHFPIIMAALLARPAHSFKMRPIAYDAPPDEEIEPEEAEDLIDGAGDGVTLISSPGRSLSENNGVRAARGFPEFPRLPLTLPFAAGLLAQLRALELRRGPAARLVRPVP